MFQRIMAKPGLFKKVLPFVAFLLFSVLIQAQTIDVDPAQVNFNNGDGLCSLYEAIQTIIDSIPAEPACNVPNGVDEVIVNLAAGSTYMLDTDPNMDGVYLPIASYRLEGNGATIMRAPAAAEIIMIGVNSAFTINNVILANSGMAAAIDISALNVTINDVEFINNGIGVSMTTASDIMIQNSTFRGAGSGIGIVTGEAMLSVFNSTFSGLTTGLDINTAMAELNHLTVANNQVGINAVFADGTLISNSIIDNPAGTNCTGETLVSTGFNIDSDSSCGFVGLGDLNGVDPLLNPLTNNGGLTSTHLPQANSPAIDGNQDGQMVPCLNADQRGFSRPRDGNGDLISDCDIGAVEIELTDIDLAVTSVANLSSVSLGDTIIYTITVINNGPAGDAMTNVSTAFPADLINVTWSCSPAQLSICTSNGTGNINDSVVLPRDGMVVYTVTAEVGVSAINEIFLTTTVTPEMLLTDINTVNNSATTTVNIGMPNFDLAISKTDNLVTAEPGDPVTYTIIVEHLGDLGIDGVVTDIFPTGLSNINWTCQPGFKSSCPQAGAGDINANVFLLEGDAITFTIDAIIDPGFNGALTNTATVDVNLPSIDPNLINNSATDVTMVLPPNADLSITKTDNVATANPGDLLNYQITVQHLGDVTVPDATVTDVFPNGLININWVCVADPGAVCPAAGGGDINAAVSLEPMSSLTFIVNAEVDEGFLGTLENTADVVVNAPEIDPVSENNSSTDMTEVTPVVADLGISKTVDLPTADPGDVITYNVVVQHILTSKRRAGTEGQFSIVDAQVVDVLASALINANWVCSADSNSICPGNGTGDIDETVSIAEGEQVVFTITATVAQGATGIILNQASVTAVNAVDSDLNNNISEAVSTAINLAFDLSVSKTDGQSSSLPGAAINYTIIVNNNSEGSINAARVTDVLPEELIEASWVCTASLGSFCGAAGVGDINELVNLTSGGAATFVVSATIDEVFEGTLQNTATVVTPNGVEDQLPQNNQSTDFTFVRGLADLAVTKAGPDIAISGTELVFDVVVSNLGPNLATDVTMMEVWSDGLALENIDAGAFNCGEPIGSIVLCEMGELAVGDSVSLQFTFSVDAAMGAVLTNQAFVSSTTSDSVASNNQSTVITMVATPLFLSPESNNLIDATVGAEYFANITAMGGLDPVSLQVTGMPEGLEAVINDRDIQISGVPVRAGAAQLEVIAQDSVEPTQVVSRIYNLQVSTELILAPDALPSANTSSQYLAVVQPINGLAPYVIEVSGLPTGLLNNNGKIQGRPNNAGVFQLQVSAVDSQGNVGSQSYNLVVESGLQLPAQVIPDAILNVSYGYQLVASGGVQPNSWSGGVGLPVGVTLADTGFISGEPQMTGEFSFSATVTDIVGTSTSGQFTLSVLPDGLMQQQINFPNGLVNQVYETPTAVAGGEQPYDCMLLDSNLPPGLILNGCNLGISGTPQQAGSFQFSLAVTDSRDAEQNLIIPARIQVIEQTPVAQDQPPDLGFLPTNNSPVPEFGVGSPGIGFTDESAQAIAVDAFGNRYLVGFGWNGSDYDIRILKYDTRGEMVWEQRFDSGSHDYGYAVTLSPLDQSLYVAGYSLRGSEYVGVLQRYDLAGVLQRTIIDDIDSPVKAYYALQADMLGVYAIGEVFSGGGFDGLVVRYDHDGNRLFQVQRDSGDSETAYAGGLTNCDINGVCDLVFGGFEGDDVPTGWIATVDRSGAGVQALSQLADPVFTLQSFSNGDWLIGSTSNNNDWVLSRVNSGGSSVWTTTVTQGERLRGTAIDQGDFIFAAGNTSGSGGSDGLVVSLNSAGQMLESMTIDNGEAELLTGSLIGPEGILTLVGEQSVAEDARFLLLNLNTGKAF